MAKQFDRLDDELREWIAQQHLFFVATAAPEGRVNLSPKGQDSLRVLSPNSLLWLNLTGSGNESAAHLQALNRMTIMWCAFEGSPRILRVYGSAETIHPHHPDWDKCSDLLPAPVGARQYFQMHIDLVQTSCGFAVPFMDFVNDRDVLTRWAEKRGQSGIDEYWKERNQTSMDGLPTGILEGD